MQLKGHKIEQQGRELMKTLTLVFALIVSTQIFAAEVADVDCPALNESSIEKGSNEVEGQVDNGGATQE
jgi:hypothetical protein